MSRPLIREAEVIPYALELAEPYRTARGVLERREMVLLRVRCGHGLEGLGEGVSLSLRGGADTAQVLRELAGAARRLVGMAVGPTLEWTSRAAREALAPDASPPALAAAETALIDLASRIAGVPAWRLLGGAEARPLEVNATLVAGAPKEVADRAAAAARGGFETVKLKLGIDLEQDVGVVEAVRAAAGPSIEIRVDANEAWDEPTAIEALRRFEPARIELCEQPVAGLEAMSRVRAASGARLAADESVVDVESAERAIAAGACDAATAKLSKVGGPSVAIAISKRLPVYLSSALDGAVGIAAAAHAAQVIEGDAGSALAHGLATSSLFADTVASRECELAGGLLRLPGGPGLGVELDEAALERHRLDRPRE